MTSSDNNNCQSNEYFQQLMLIKKEYTKIKYIKSLYKSSIICNITLGVILLIIFILSDSRLCNIDTIEYTFDKKNNTQEIDSIVRKYIVELDDNIRNIEKRFNINIDNIKSEIDEIDRTSVKQDIDEIDIQMKQYNKYNELYEKIDKIDIQMKQYNKLYEKIDKIDKIDIQTKQYNKYNEKIDKIKLKQYNEYDELYEKKEGVNTRLMLNSLVLWCIIICIMCCIICYYVDLYCSFSNTTSQNSVTYRKAKADAKKN